MSPLREDVSAGSAHRPSSRPSFIVSGALYGIAFKTIVSVGLVLADHARRGPVVDVSAVIQESENADCTDVTMNVGQDEDVLKHLQSGKELVVLNASLRIEQDTAGPIFHLRMAGGTEQRFVLSDADTQKSARLVFMDPKRKTPDDQKASWPVTLKTVDARDVFVKMADNPEPSRILRLDIPHALAQLALVSQTFILPHELSDLIAKVVLDPAGEDGKGHLLTLYGKDGSTRAVRLLFQAK